MYFDNAKINVYAWGKIIIFYKKITMWAPHKHFRIKGF